MTAPALFPEPTPTFDLPPFPAELVKDTADREGLRYIDIGDEGEWVVVLGHHDREPIEAFANWYAKDRDFYEDDANYYDDLDFTWGHLLEKCPDHVKDCPSTCVYASMEPGTWWLDWSVPKGEKSDVHCGAAGYFPITVWGVES